MSTDSFLSRRQMLTRSAVTLGGGLLLINSRNASSQEMRKVKESQRTGAHAASSEREYRGVITPNGTTLQHKLIDGAKVFHLVAEELEHEFASGLKALCWGYNGRVHGPTIEAVEGDRVRIYVTNHLNAPTTIHWHGIILPSGMDGVGGLSQRPILPDETYLYEFELRQHGTFMYHSHHDEMTQMALGLMGMFIIHPRSTPKELPDHDFVYMLSEWRIDPGTRRPDPNEMSEFNVLTLNARVFPGAEPMIVKQGERVRIRFGNLSAMDHHPIHIHGHNWKVISTDGGDIPESAQWPETTVLVPVGATRTVEFIASNPGDWAMHCHMTHHVMNQMGHGIPNMIGVNTEKAEKKVTKLLPDYMAMGATGMGDMATMGMPVPENSIPMVGAPGPYDYITMGGMFTILKVRETLADYKDPGWYVAPAGTVASKANEEQLKRDGLTIRPRKK